MSHPLFATSRNSAFIQDLPSTYPGTGRLINTSVVRKRPWRTVNLTSASNRAKSTTQPALHECSSDTAAYAAHLLVEDEERRLASSAAAPAAPSTEDAAVEDQLVAKNEGAGPEKTAAGVDTAAAAASEEPHKGDSSAVLAGLAQPPCRMRLYFHSPVTPEDARPIPAGAGMVFAPEDGGARKGKRKKLEDDDGDDERRAPPPPPGGMHDRDRTAEMIDRGSVAPSVAETTSEGDWLMAAIGEDADADADADGETDGELHVSEAYEDGHFERAESESHERG